MKENSIEEYKNSNFSIEAKFESMIKMAKEIISQNKEGAGDCSIETALAYDVAAYLSNYKRVLKENEELKEDRKNNNEMIALAQNEILNYMSGYEEGKKHKMTAVAQVVENQQYYIIRKQMEKYEEHIKRLQKENEELNLKYNILYTEKIEKQKAQEVKIKSQVISKQKVKDKIEHYQKLQDNYIEKYDEINEGLQAMINVLQELLEGRK